MKKLAIIIPAYKDTYLHNALSSISNQTCKDFNLYIGDDASPYDLTKIIKPFYNKLNITYKRFDKNIGGKNLVKQWERCIELTQGEEWLWLFSDDDEMDKDCVKNFYMELNKTIRYDLYHFNINIIDANSNIKKTFIFPEHLNVIDFIRRKSRGKIESFVVEYIFSREIYLKEKGFQQFDLAWNSDDATWIKFGKEKGIKTIKGGKISWRESPYNISPNNTNKELIERKIKANIKYIDYIKSCFSNYIFITRLLRPIATWQITNLCIYRKVLTSKTIIQYIKISCNHLNAKYIYPLALLYYSYKKNKI